MPTEPKTAAVRIGVLKETAPGERRVAAVPDTVSRLVSAGLEAIVERGAGTGSGIPDSAYAESGAVLSGAAEIDARADLLLCVTAPDHARVAGLHAGQTLAGMLQPDPDLLAVCADRGLTAVSLLLLPRTLSRAQALDALTSQANIAGYRAAVLAAATYERFFPMLTTAAGTSQPARVLVLGAGVAGLSAIGTVRRLGALVTGYDIRPEAADEVRSMGARFLDLDPGAGTVSGTGSGGYARVLSEGERDAQQAALQERIREFDIVITTARVPGRRPPVLVTRDALKAVRSGSVVVDLAAGPLGGNVEGSVPGHTAVLEGGVTVIGAGDLASSMAAGASAAYARNTAALVGLLVRDGALAIDLDDEIQDAIVAVHRGAVRHPHRTARDESARPETAGGAR
jgi:NAD(P) transhydrogenase subunit alpha